MSKARIELDTDDTLKAVGSASKGRGVGSCSCSPFVGATHALTALHTITAYERDKVITCLQFENRDFLIVARASLLGPAATVAQVADKVVQQAAPTEAEVEPPRHSGEEYTETVAPETVQTVVTQVADVVCDGVVKTAEDAVHSIAEHLSGAERETLLFRLKETVSKLKLRQRTDCDHSVSTIGILVQRYAQTYSCSLAETLETVSGDVQHNPELNRALEKQWTLVGSLGDRRA